MIKSRTLEEVIEVCDLCEKTLLGFLIRYEEKVFCGSVCLNYFKHPTKQKYLASLQEDLSGDRRTLEQFEKEKEGGFSFNVGQGGRP